MKRAFLYIDILGFENLVRTKSDKVDEIFKIFDSLKVHKHFALQTVVFSGDKILKIDLSAKSNSARLEGSLKHILEKWEGFDYSTVK